MTLEEIGRRLREARERKGLTLHDVQVATKIRRKYLEALERGDDAELPPEVYTRGFIRAYASLVDLDGMELARAYGEWKQGRAAADPGAGTGTARVKAPPGGATAGPGELPEARHGESMPGPAAGDEPGDRTAWGAVPRDAAEDGAGGRTPRAAGADRGPVAEGPEGADWVGPRESRRATPPGEPRRPAATRPESWPAPSLVPPVRGRRGTGRGGGMDPATGGPARRARPWGRWLVGLVALAAVVGVVLYVAGAPEQQAGRPPAGTGLQGQAPGGQPAAPGGNGGGGAAAPGGAGPGPQTPVEEPPAEPAAPQVTVRREGSDVYYTIRPEAPGGGGAPAAGGAGGAGEGPVVTLAATERVWVRVRDAGGQVIFEQLMQAGDRREVPLGDGLFIRAGYPRGLALHLGATELDVPDEQSPLNLHLEPASGPGTP